MTHGCHVHSPERSSAHPGDLVAVERPARGPEATTRVLGSAAAASRSPAPLSPEPGAPAGQQRASSASCATAPCPALFRSSRAGLATWPCPRRGRRRGPFRSCRARTPRAAATSPSANSGAAHRAPRSQRSYQLGGMSTRPTVVRGTTAGPPKKVKSLTEPRDIDWLGSSPLAILGTRRLGLTPSIAQHS